jgi:hypothetical protein
MLDKDIVHIDCDSFPQTEIGWGNVLLPQNYESNCWVNSRKTSAKRKTGAPQSGLHLELVRDLLIQESVNYNKYFQFMLEIL